MKQGKLLLQFLACCNGELVGLIAKRIGKFLWYTKVFYRGLKFSEAVW
jgi:hypothetical protein